MGKCTEMLVFLLVMQFSLCAGEYITIDPMNYDYSPPCHNKVSDTGKELCLFMLVIL